MATWEIEQARENLEQLMERAEKEGPQILVQNGQERWVVLSIETYRALEAKRQASSTSP